MDETSAQELKAKAESDAVARAEAEARRKKLEEENKRKSRKVKCLLQRYYRTTLFSRSMLTCPF